MIKEIPRNLVKKFPRKLKNLGKMAGGEKIMDLIYDKHDVEFYYQRGWAKLFSKTESKMKVKEYLDQYRYLNKIIKITGIKEDTPVLDVGCGISSILHFLPSKNLIGVDPLAKRYHKLYKYPRPLKILQRSGEDLGFKDNSFEVVFCINALDHTSNYKKVISEIKRVLRPGGYFVLMIEYFDPGDNVSDRGSAHPHDFSEKNALEIFKRNNDFKILLNKNSPWIGLKPYVEGKTKSENKEVIIMGKLLKKKLKKIF